jgi:hypothetical protein
LELRLEKVQEEKIRGIFVETEDVREYRYGEYEELLTK